ncbi:flagellar protein FlgN [Thalassotalea sp. M1531]|uniref:Flagellar protein FlgN n=1 Tax=Thalassotalea algicola TaxID=2716224 RepID=A0A7Y0Q7Y3_9GAMM|nr:flagellar protein FlgN [Thalassotalea algicola]NMP32868.1 flagellar protein FlgN [Thalassotalea algicola]
MTESASHQLLNKQLEQLHALESLLAEEKEALTKHNPEVLSAITTKKHELLLAIESFDANIGSNLQFIEDKKQGHLDNKLAEIQEVLKHCKELNEVNGQIIHHSELAVERMKNTLLERHSKSTMTYDAKGKKSAGLSSLDIKA